MSLAPHTTPPSAHRPLARRTTEHLAPHGQKRPRSGGSSYTPGMFDALIDRPVLGGAARPEQIRGVTIELAASGRSVIVAEHLHAGAGPRHLLTLDEPHSVFMRLADGREVWIEVRAVEQVPEEDREPWGEEEAVEVGYGASVRKGTIGGQLSPSSFSCPDFLPR